jgi:hypothetical protein
METSSLCTTPPGRVVGRPMKGSRCGSGGDERSAMGCDAGKLVMPDLNPEQRAREDIDSQLLACGWVIQDYKMARQIRATLSLGKAFTGPHTAIPLPRSSSRRTWNFLALGWLSPRVPVDEDGGR